MKYNIGDNLKPKPHCFTDPDVVTRKIKSFDNITAQYILEFKRKDGSVSYTNYLYESDIDFNYEVTNPMIQGFNNTSLSDKQINEIFGEDIFKREYQCDIPEKKCICSNHTLFNCGCKCGYIQHERKCK